jgi:hypothetical protein
MTIILEPTMRGFSNIPLDLPCNRSSSPESVAQPSLTEAQHCFEAAYMNHLSSHLLTASEAFLGTFGPPPVLRAASFPEISLHHLYHSLPQSGNLKAMMNPPTQILTQQQVPQVQLGLTSGRHQNIAAPQPVPINIAHALPLIPTCGHLSTPKFNSSSCMNFNDSSKT